MIVKTSPDEIQSYLSDASNVKGNCSAVYFPESQSELSSIMADAYSNATPITVSGNGTGLAGGRVPEGGIVISTEKLNKVIEINPEAMYARVEAGVILSGFLEQVKSHGLLYPPDPTEKNCFIGGTVATNASGEKTFKYGPTRNYVLALNVVLSNGELLELERGKHKASGSAVELKTASGTSINISLPEYTMPQTKNASGYYCRPDMDAVDLFIGSEGTLGIITEVKLKLLKYPYNILSCIVFFDEMDNALSFIEDARSLSYSSRENSSPGIDALALEFFDGNALNFLRDDYPQIPSSAKGAVWFEQEVDQQDEDDILNNWMELIEKHKGDEESAWFAFTDTDKEKIQQFRHAVSWKVADYISKNNFKKLGTDVAVPHSSFRELFFFSRTEVEKAGLNFITYGHFGNSHMHLNMLPRNDAEYVIGKNIYNDICRKAVELKGTVSAEHGIGKLKTSYLLDMYGSDIIDSMFSIKKILDPRLILGQGTLFKTGL